MCHDVYLVHHGALLQNNFPREEEFFMQFYHLKLVTGLDIVLVLYSKQIVVREKLHEVLTIWLRKSSEHPLNRCTFETMSMYSVWEMCKAKCSI